MAAKKISELPVATSVQPADQLVVVQDSQSKRVAASVLFAGAAAPYNPVSSLVLAGTPEIVTFGAVSVLSNISHLNLVGTNAITLAAGVQGQIKVLVAVSGSGGTTTLSNNVARTVVFDGVGDSAILIYTEGKWVFIGGTATVA